ncbi:MAG: cupin domain-containing protein [SAR324 cluster bacterium]|nr:cupin domain-containing protein [SAR324 cluster bacterium]
MNTTKLGLGLVLAGALSLGTAFSQDAQAAEYKPKAVVKSLVEVPLAGVDGKTVIIKHFTLPAGFVGGKHFHPGPVFVYVLEGTLTVETDSGTLKVSAGEVYQEIPRMVMRATNISASEPVKIVVFQVGETGKPMMIKAK